MICIIPVGSYEQHGPYLPPTVDGEIAAHVAERIGGRLGARVLAPVWYTCSKEHEDFAETVSVDCGAFLAYMGAVLKSAARSCDVIVVVAGHGGVADAGNMLSSQLNYELGPRILWLNIWSLAPVRDHAGSDEASVYLATGGRLLKEPDAEICEGDVRHMKYLKTSWMSKTGVVGCLKPGEVSAERGRALLETLVDKALQRVNDFITSIRSSYRA
ncbi:MAG: creatininase family protein [Thermoproteus sp.]|nr:creatininase family protein [Thermoproteus sp.]